MDKEEFRKLLAKWAQEDVYISQLTWEEGDSLAEYLSKWYLKERTEELARYDKTPQIRIVLSVNGKELT